MKKLYLHIGSPKTGTTSIQNIYFENKIQLKKQGYIYPGKEIKHHKLFFVSNSPEDEWPIVYNGVNKRKLKKEVENYLQELDQVMRNSCKDHIISSEYLFINSKEHVKNVIQHLANFFSEIIVMIFVRDPVEYYRSFEAQKIHARSYVTCPNLFRYKFKKVIETWSTFCRVKVIEYNTQINSCNALSKEIGIKYEKLHQSKEKINRTESIEQLLLLEKIQKRIYPSEDNIYKNHLSAIWNSKPLFKNKPLLKEDIKTIIKQNHNEDLEWLKAKYNIDFLNSSSESVTNRAVSFKNGKATIRDIYKVNEQMAEVYEAAFIDILLKKLVQG